MATSQIPIAQERRPSGLRLSPACIKAPNKINPSDATIHKRRFKSNASWKATNEKSISFKNHHSPLTGAIKLIRFNFIYALFPATQLTFKPQTKPYSSDVRAIFIK
ncbi:hypothetical protein LXL04_014342 [Taraxacum kok-saghyz]